MKPVAIIRFSPSEGPGYLADFLDAAGIPWQLIRIDAGDPVPFDSTVYGGIAMMGGPMSVNDPLPWIPPLLDLIRQCVDRDIPLLGHCLGGQMMAKALGGEITDNKCMEKGWHTVEVVEGPQARKWFGDVREFTTFQWHYQTFSIPSGAAQVLRNDYCENQAFAIGPHIGFQCHIEMTGEMVDAWCAAERDNDGTVSRPSSVQDADDILRAIDMRVPALNSIATGVYRCWLEGVAR